MNNTKTLAPVVEPFMAMRLPDWEVKLTHFLHDSLRLKESLAFSWQDTNCTSWVGQAIEVMTGKNPYEPFDGLHKSVAQACRTIKIAGFTSLDDLIQALFGHREVSIAYVTKGDLVLVPVLEGWTCAPQQDGPDDLVTHSVANTVMPHAIALADPPFYRTLSYSGLSHAPLNTMYKAFAIGRDVGRPVSLGIPL